MLRLLLMDTVTSNEGGDRAPAAAHVVAPTKGKRGRGPPLDEPDAPSKRPRTRSLVAAAAVQEDEALFVLCHGWDGVRGWVGLCFCGGVVLLGGCV